MPVRATPSDDSDEWASRFAQDDSVFPVILRSGTTKNPGCRRTCSGYSPLYARGPRVPRRGIGLRPQDDSVTVILKREALKNPGCRRTCYGYSLSYGRGPRVPRRGIASLRMTPELSF